MADREPRKPHDRKRLKVPDDVDFEELVGGLLEVDPEKMPPIYKQVEKPD